MLENINTLILLNLICSFLMLGVILTTQIVNYPSFLDLSINDFINFHKNYVSRITIIVFPIMVLELILGFILFWNIKNISTILIATSILFIFISTLLIQVPLHQKVEKKYDRYLLIQLIKSNWIRTILWTIKCAVSCNLIIKESLWI